MPPIMFFSNFPMSYARWSSTPMFYSQCNWDNSGNNKWLNWWMMSEMVKNIGQMFRKQDPPQVPYAYPYAQNNPYAMFPYVKFNNQQQAQYLGQEEPDRDLMQLQQMYNGKFKISKFTKKDGEEIYVAVDKNGKRIKGEDAESLMDAIDAYVEGQGGTRVNNSGDSDSDVDVDSDSDIDVDTDTDVHTDTDSDSDNDTGVRVLSSGARRARLSEGYNWTSYRALTDIELKSKIINEMTIDELIKATLGDDHVNDTYRQYLRDMNPNAIRDGKIVDVNKLDFILKDEENQIPGWAKQTWRTDQLENVNNINNIIDLMTKYGNGRYNMRFADQTKKEKLINDLREQNPGVFKDDGTVNDKTKLANLKVPYVNALQHDYGFVVKVPERGWPSVQNNPNDAARINWSETLENTQYDPVDAIINRLWRFYGLQGNTISADTRKLMKKDLIYFNPSMFNNYNGEVTLREGYDINKLQYPNKETFQQYLGITSDRSTTTTPVISQHLRR